MTFYSVLTICDEFFTLLDKKLQPQQWKQLSTISASFGLLANQVLGKGITENTNQFEEDLGTLELIVSNYMSHSV